MKLRYPKSLLNLLKVVTKNRVFFLLLVFNFFPNIAKSQVRNVSKSLLYDEIIIPYSSFFRQTRNGNINFDDKIIQNIFSNPTLIENDFFIGSYLSNPQKCASWEVYRGKILLINQSDNYKIIDVDFDLQNTKYGKYENYYFIWLKKRILLTEEVDENTTRNIDLIRNIKFSIKKVGNEYKIHKAEIVLSFPNDYDNDEIADDYDEDKYSKTKNVNLLGKEIILDTKPTTNSIPVSDFIYFDKNYDKKRKKAPPYSRWDLKLTPTGYLPFGSSFNEKELNTNNTEISSSGFAKIGYGGSLAIDLNITKNFGLTTGYQFYRFGIDGENLKNRIISFLRNNNQAVNNIQLQNQGYLFHSTYFGAFVGKIDDLGWSIKIQPFSSYIIPIKNNPITVNINYTNTSQEITKLELTPKPFFAFGGTVYFLFPDIEEEAIRFHLYASYLNSTIPFNTNKIPFQTLATKLQFNDMKLNLFSLGAGVHISLKVPNKYK